jgi:hypothetical protein
MAREIIIPEYRDSIKKGIMKMARAWVACGAIATKFIMQHRKTRLMPIAREATYLLD